MNDNDEYLLRDCVNLILGLKDLCRIRFYIFM